LIHSEAAQLLNSKKTMETTVICAIATIVICGALELECK